jgi:PIN domain nuclease of toxin-antitoxin system
VSVLLDTHFLIWITTCDQRKLDRFPWLDRYQPWTLSPMSLLEIRYLTERGRLQLDPVPYFEEVLHDVRFVVDDPALVALVRHAFDLSWTRDPFDRMLSAHSLARRLPLCTTDRVILANHRLLVSEIVRGSGT